MDKEKKEEIKEEDKKYRQIIIETDGSEIRIVKAEIAWLIELRGILTSLIGYCDNPPAK